MTEMDKLEVVAHLHTMQMELDQTQTRITAFPDAPFGKPGRDYDGSYTVTSEPLVRLSDAQAAIDRATQSSATDDGFVDLILVEAALDEAESELVACSEYLDPLIDADGDSEGFQPNREMTLQAGVHSALRHIDSVRRSLELGVSKPVTPEPGLSALEQAAQAQRCGCRGADDLCPCQNTPDRETKKERSRA